MSCKDKCCSCDCSWLCCGCSCFDKCCGDGCCGGKDEAPAPQTIQRGQHVNRNATRVIPASKGSMTNKTGKGTKETYETYTETDEDRARRAELAKRDSFLRKTYSDNAGLGPRSY